MKVLLTVITLVTLSVAALGQARADLILVNGNVRTIDSSRPRAEAIASSGGRIIAVGTNTAIRALAGPDTKVIDAGRRLVVPGFNDSHVHFTSIGVRFSHLSLKGVGTSGEVVKRLAEYTRVLPEGRWIFGSGLGTSAEPAAAIPTLDQLDAATPNHPVIFYLDDPRSALVNSAALRSVRTSLPVGRDDEGRPTGIVSGAALRTIRNAVPKDFSSNWEKIAETASNYAASLGVTSVQDVHSDDLIETYREMAAAGRLKTRIYECIGIKDRGKLSAAGTRAATGSPMVRGGCVKGSAQGDDGEIAELSEAIADADKAGLQVMIHAIGESANANTLTAFERAIAENGQRDRRFRSEHARRVRSGDLSRFARAGIIPSMQPHLFFSGAGAASDDYRSMHRLGIRLAFGSDAWITELNPMLGIYAAVNAGPGRSLTVGEAVAAYTIGSAYAEFQEAEKGTIETGKLADFVILSDDIFVIDQRKIDKVRVMATIMDGRVVYENN